MPQLSTMDIAMINRVVQTGADRVLRGCTTDSLFLFLPTTMTFSEPRRRLLLAAAAAPVLAFTDGCAGAARVYASGIAAPRFAALERAAGGRLGVAAIDTHNGNLLEYRAEQRFAFCSTFKLMLTSAVLRRSATEAGLLQQRLRYAKSDLVAYSPITEDHLDEGMTVHDLCAAAMEYSDNTAANLLIKLLGGPAAVTGFARAIGDRTFRLDRWETELNTAIPDDPRDTTTARAMMHSLQAVALGEALAQPQRDQLQQWLLANTTGDERIRAGVPAGWRVGDKTGSGNYGVSNDIAVLWPPGRQPIVLVVYFSQPRKDAPTRSDVIASAAGMVCQILTGAAG